jgi:S1-C subfamily serine protease
MKKQVSGLLIVALALSIFVPTCLARDAAADALRRQERFTVSLELEFSKKSPNALDRVITFLDWGANGYATGFVVGEGLIITAYHVVSGELSGYKKMALGFAPSDELEVKVHANGCHARVLKVDKDADLALLEVHCSFKQNQAPAFQLSVNKDDKLLLIARPHGDSIVRKGTLMGSYPLNGLQFWSATLNARDGFSGSPVYNERAELVGVMSGYDPSKKLALISPGFRVQKLLADYTANLRPIP